MLMRLWARRNDLILTVYAVWLTVLTVAHFGPPWQW
jgi:hypothetical protein